MSKNAGSHKRPTYIWICANCKSSFETKKLLLAHFNDKCELNVKDIKIRDLNYDRIRVIGPTSQKKVKASSALLAEQEAIELLSKPNIKLKLVKNESEYVVLNKNRLSSNGTQDQVENLKMYNLRPVNPNLHVKKDGNGNGNGAGVGSDSIGGDSTKNSTSNQLMNLKNASLTMPLKNEYTSSVAYTTSTVVKHSSNPDMPRIKYYGSLRNNSNFSKMIPLNSPSLSKAVNTQSADYCSDDNLSKSSNGPMTRLRRSGNEQSTSNTQQAAQKRPSAVLESKKAVPSTSALAQRLASNTSKNSSVSNTSRKSTLIDLASDEDEEKSFETSTPNKRLKPSNEPDISSLYGIPILDFSHDETIKQCSENGITAFIPLKALNSNEPSELCLPLIQVKDFENKRFLFSTNRFLRIGTIKSINKSN